jgi:hypothetical protein
MPDAPDDDNISPPPPPSAPSALHEIVRDHPVTSLLAAALIGLILGKLAF